MTEPPAKRARRTDSSTMWDMNDKRTRSSRSSEPDSDHDKAPRKDATKQDGYRSSRREDRRNRSRSLDRVEKRMERSRSRDRYDWDRDRDRPKQDRDRDGRGARNRERSTNKDMFLNRKGFTSLSDRHERSRSPVHNGGGHSRTPPPRSTKTERREDRKRPRSGDAERQINGISDRKSWRAQDEETDADVEMKGIYEDSEDTEEIMQRTMGFTRFRSTQNTKVPGNDIYGVRKEKKTQYRQYMNRSGGFNRPLSPTR